MSGADALARGLAVRLGRLPAPVPLLGLAAVVVALWAVLAAADPFIGHDEAVYAAKGRAWVSDLPSAGWQAYRPVVLPLLAAGAHLLGGGLLALRLVALVLALASLWLVHRLGLALTTRPRALVAVLVVLTGPSLQRRLPELLDDIAAAGLLVAVCTLLVSVSRGGSGRLLVAAAGLSVLAFYVRYGVVLGLLAVLVAALVVLGPRSLLREPRAVAAAALVLAAGTAPFLVWSSQLTGSPLGVLRAAGGVARAGSRLDGLRLYVSELPTAVAGPLGALLVLAAIAYAGLLLARRAPAPGDRGVLFVVVAALLDVLALGLSAHGEARYVFFPVMVLVVVGVHAVGELAGRWRPTALLTLAGAAALLVPLTAVPVAGVLHRVRAEREVLAEAAAAGAGHRPCTVVATQLPEAGWYSGCRTLTPRAAARQGLPGGRTLLVVPQSGAAAPLTGAALADLVRGREVSRQTFGPAGPRSVLLLTLAPTAARAPSH